MFYGGESMAGVEWLRQRLQEPLPGFSAQERMMGRVIPAPPVVPQNARISAVLCLLYPGDTGLQMLLMRRIEDGRAHSGQVSFPGGRQEPEDPSLLDTALREANEEVGVNREDIDVLGPLSSLYIPVSNFNVFPFVAFARARPAVRICEQEVSYLIEVPLAHLLDDRNKILTEVVSPALPGVKLKTKAYNLTDGGIIWGATAMMISELEVLMKEHKPHW